MVTVSELPTGHPALDRQRSKSTLAAPYTNKVDQPPYLPENVSFKEIDMEAAMCLWEAMLDLREKDDTVNAAFEAHGSVALRHSVMTLVDDCQKEWEALSEEERVHFLPYDWEWCPKFLAKNLWRIGIGEKPVVSFEDYSTDLVWTTFRAHQMGRGIVAFAQSEEERAAGQYDPHGMFYHRDMEKDDPETQERVEKDCFALLHYLGKFRIDNDCITAQVKNCGVGVTKLSLLDLLAEKGVK